MSDDDKRERDAEIAEAMARGHDEAGAVRSLTSRAWLAWQDWIALQAIRRKAMKGDPKP